MTFRVTQYVRDYIKLEGDTNYKEVEAEVCYESHNYDDLQNFLLTMVENAVKPVKFKIEKKEDE